MSKKALKYFKKKSKNFFNREYVCSETDIQQEMYLQYAIEALSKQVELKVIKTKTSSQACPICKKNVNWNYCSNCGQKLNYSLL